jgi:hypothetical protein
MEINGPICLYCSNGNAFIRHLKPKFSLFSLTEDVIIKQDVCFDRLPSFFKKRIEDKIKLLNEKREMFLELKEDESPPHIPQSCCLNPYIN